ncbi:MAG: alpha/beta hydrolase [Oscillospiraceae bacterium]|nr:alpha/beta hydrolase [Oscillospiraceae bacterium]
MKFLKTPAGCKKMIVLFICLILIFSFAASMLQSSSGKVSISNVKFDARGAVQDADLYMPVGTNSHSSLPCVILSHGGGCTKDTMTGYASELARRGFVVLNVSSYGSGLSEQPMFDEDEIGASLEELNVDVRDTSSVEGQANASIAVKAQGMWDAINYVRTLTFVDQSNIVIAGHSQGGYRVCYAALHDCPFLSFNDAMINFMYDEFGIAFKEEEISKDAAELAKEHLNDDQLLYFQAKYDETKEYYDTRVKGVVSIGNTVTGVPEAFSKQKVIVAGYEVERFIQTNLAFLCGQWDHNFMFLDPTVAATQYFQTGDSMPIDTWVAVDSNGDTGTILGDFNTESVVSSDALAEAIENRCARVYMAPEKITHSSEFLSKRAVSDMVQYAAQITGYNNGPLDGANNAIKPDNIIWLNREFCNFFAMIAMLGLAVSMLGLLSCEKGFEKLTYVPNEEKLIAYNKKEVAAFYIIAVLILCQVTWLSNNSMKMMANPLVVLLPSNKFYPLDKTSCFCYVYLCWGAILLAVLMAVFCFYNKKKYGKTGLEQLGIRVGWKAFFKALLAALIVFLTCYASEVVIRYIFHQDYRLWMCIFTDMKLYHWTQALRYLPWLVVPYFVFCSVINMIPDKKGRKLFTAVLISVLIGSAGVILNHFVHVTGMYTGSDAEHFFVKLISEGSICGGMLIFVPITVFIAKFTYKQTGSVWTGVWINSFLNAWLWVSAISSTNVYMGTTFAEKFLGF